MLVEGAKDIESLEKLGVNGHLIPLNQGKSIIDLCTDLSVRFEEVVILMDWDSKGNRLCSLLKQGLKACDTCFDTRLRGRLAAILKKEIKDVQGIYSFITRNHPELFEPRVGEESLTSTGEEKAREDSM